MGSKLHSYHGQTGAHRSDLLGLCSEVAQHTVLSGQDRTFTIMSHACSAKSPGKESDSAGVPLKQIKSCPGYRFHLSIPKLRLIQELSFSELGLGSASLGLVLIATCDGGFRMALPVSVESLSFQQFSIESIGVITPVLFWAANIPFKI